MSKVCSKARQALGAIFRLKTLLGCSDLAVLFKASVQSTLEYGNLEYFAAAPGYLRRLDRVQERAERLCGQWVDSSLLWLIDGKPQLLCSFANCWVASA